MKKTVRRVQKGKRLQRFLKTVLIPSYDELSVFLICTFFFVTFLVDDTCRKDFLAIYDFSNFSSVKVFFTAGIGFFIGWILALTTTLFLFLGAVVSLVSVLDVGEKKGIDRNILKITEMILSAFIGFKGLEYCVTSKRYDLLISPVLNLLAAFFFWYSFAFPRMDKFDQKDVSKMDLFLCLLICSGLFIALYFVARFHWSIVLSFSVSYTLTVNEFIASLPSTIGKKQ